MQIVQTVLMLTIITLLLISIYRILVDMFREAAEAEAEEKYGHIIQKQKAEIKRLQHQINHPKITIETKLWR